jgi:biotin carboxyl carrier protein
MPARRYRVSIGDRTLEVEVDSRGDTPTVTLDGERLPAEMLPADASGLRRLRIGERVYELLLVQSADRVALALEGVSLEVGVEDERAARLAQFGGGPARAGGREVIAAPMPGLVVRVNVEPGRAVTAGESLVVLQAMKMENELASPRDGTVKAVAVEPGQAVEQGQVLVELE